MRISLQSMTITLSASLINIDGATVQIGETVELTGVVTANGLPVA
jgi:hypothetical protein